MTQKERCVNKRNEEREDEKKHKYFTFGLEKLISSEAIFISSVIFIFKF